MATAQELGAFNLAVARGDYAGAARIAQQAGYSPDVVASYVNQNLAGLNLPTTANISSDVVSSLYEPPQRVTVPAASSPSLAYVAPPPSPPPAPPPQPSSGLNAIVQSTGPAVGTLENPAVASPITMGAAPNINVNPQPEPEPYVDTQAQTLLDQFNAEMASAMASGDFAGAANIIKEAEGIYGDAVYDNVANYLNTADIYGNLREAIGGANYTPENLRAFTESLTAPVTSGAGDVGTPGAGGAPVGGGDVGGVSVGAGADVGQPGAGASVGTPGAGGTPGTPPPPPPQTTPNAGQIYGLPALTRQAPSQLTFAPLRRGSTQLRPAMYMPGLTSRAPALGGSGFTPEQLQEASTRITQEGEAAGKTPAQIAEDFAYMMDVGGVSPAELGAATLRAPGEIQGLYNLSRPGGMFSTIGPTPTGLPQDFRLQTGAYERETTPTFLTLPEPKTETKAPTPAAEPVEFTGSKEGGMIRMAEGGEAMAKLSPAEAGSQFDISEFIDDQGRLVGGYSSPAKDEFGNINRFSVPVRNEAGAIIGYEYPGYKFQPYQRDVVFNPRLAEAEARGMSDEEREAARRGLIVRQGMTGVDPYAGGLAGIVAREAMMRNRPQYYSYAKGGDVSATAQDLASRGRGGDTMLVHMAPHEVAGLNALARMEGTELTVNPETGMPEALKLGNLFKKIAPFVPFIPGVGQFLAPAFGALGMGGFSPLLQKAITSGVIGGFTGPKGGFDLQRGLMQGITAYGLGSLQQNLGGPGAPGGPANTTSVSPEMGGVEFTGPDAGFNIAEQAAQQPFATGADAGFNIAESANVMDGGLPPTSPTFDSGSMRPVSQNLPYGTKGIPGLDPSVAPPPAPSGIGEPLSTGQALLTSGFGLASTVESDKLASAQMAAQRKREKEEDIYRRLFERTLGQVRTAKQGGLMKLAGGGMTYMEAGGTTGPTGEPRDVTGTGDGMSDSVPASIEGVQEARLADGEFVIPADVVADIGNGSSDAGSKKLYDMMDRIRMARHGTKEQPPEIKAERLMPA